jgi:hypothetical protein
MAIVYRHIRLDKNEPFYIGIGKTENRAYSKNSRNKHWWNISNKGYEVEILFNDLTWEEACEKEKEFITLYGRSDLNLGTLCNWTNGGEGSLNCKPSIETRNKIGKANTGKIKSSITLEKQRISALKKGDSHHMKIDSYKQFFSNLHKKQVEQYTKDGTLVNIWASILEASNALNIDNSSIGKACTGKLKTAGKFYWKIKL